MTTRTAAATALVLALGSGMARAEAPCRIEVVEKGSGWPVPMVEFRTTHNVRLFSDNAGLIALDLPEVMGRETWFEVTGHGYERPKDGFGFRGIRFTPQPGATQRVEVVRTIVARRLGRITGAGIFGESRKLGGDADWRETGVFGCDSVQNTVHNGRLFWLWGDTTLPRYPLGVFDCTAAFTPTRPLDRLEPPVRLRFEPFTDAKGFPRGVGKMAGSGPTWLSGLASLPDRAGAMRLVAVYAKIKPPLDAYEVGLCVWNEAASNFEHLRTVWTASAAAPKPTPHPEGHGAAWKDADGREWLLFGNPLPRIRCRPTFEAWQDPAQWEVLTPQETLEDAGGGKPVKPHSGSIAWNPWRKRWVTVFMQWFGKPSVFGELWYAEADAPTGPWGPAVKILSHENYTFYNPRIHPEFTPDDSPSLIFEGTFTAEFADKPQVTPRFNYNQILYRLDLDDPALAPARGRTQTR